MIRRPQDAFEWFIPIIVSILVALVVVLAVGAVISDQPACPAGQEYTFSHNIVVGRVIVPQYICR